MRGTLDTRLGLRPSKAFARPVPLTADVVLVALWPVSLMAHECMHHAKCLPYV